MANLKVLGMAAAMALGAAGFVACGGGKTENQTTTNPQEVKKDTVPTNAKKDSIMASPPLTMIDVGDTLVFNSKQDSIDYVKYNDIAFDNYIRISAEAQEKSDSLLNAERENYQKVQEDEQKIWGPQYEALVEKYQKKSEDLEKQYKEGKISFKQLEDAKEKIKNDERDERSKLFAKYHKGIDAERKTDLLQKLEERKVTKIGMEAHEKYIQDKMEMRKKYCKEVRPYKATAAEKPDYSGNLIIDGIKVKWKSEADSIAANEYLDKIFKEEEKLNAKLEEQIQKIDEQIEQLEYEKDQLEYEAAVLYEKGNKAAAMNKEAQAERIDTKIEQLGSKESELYDKYECIGWDLDTISKYSVQQFSKDWKEIKVNIK